MRGSIKWQVNQVFQTINRVGNSKHVAKEQARLEGANTWHDIGKRIEIYSYKTLDAYRDVARQLMGYAKAEFGLKDIERLALEHVRSFLESKIEQGVSFSTFQLYASAVEKLEVALNRYSEIHERGNAYNFELREVRDTAKEVFERGGVTRAYEDARSLIENLDTREHCIASKLQYEGGARIHEIALIREYQLKGLDRDLTGKDVGKIEVQGKGGLIRDIKVSGETYKELKGYIRENGVFLIDKDDYRAELRASAKMTNQEYTGSHGLRWNFAQERFNVLQEKAGFTYEQALKQVSEEMGHHRADITEHYLRG
ncbi:MAG: hypothetical protein D6828_03365 [Nitrospirae bacterium]|nr:MAG: hypothetical protein D6828_03365 [Nitrospirota bacterium]